MDHSIGGGRGEDKAKNGSSCLIENNGKHHGRLS